jgi:hypothetical protein
MTIPKKIWFLWFQGLSQAPLVVLKCYEYWKKYNPDWEVIFLDEDNITDYINLPLSKEKICQLSRNHQSNIIRLELLAKYGGVWADATSLCRVPLDNWLEDYSQAGFFAFIYKTRGYGWIFNWFFAAEKSNPIIVKMSQKLVSFYQDNEFYHRGKIAKDRIKFLEIFLNRKYKTTRFWTSWVVRKLFKVYPYFIFHIIFANLINSERELLELYKKMKPYYNVGDMGVSGLLRPLTPEIKERIDSRVVPIYKLSWKYAQDDRYDASILKYLLEETE